MLVHLLAYLSQDYSKTVSNGKVINEEEYEEQIEFAEKAISIQKANSPLKAEKGLSQKLVVLRDEILSKAPVTEVSALANELKWQVIGISNITLSPKSWPDLENGGRIYADKCASCHGISGKGDGIVAQGLNPKPANFLDSERMSKVSPFQAFNTTELGVEGTAMPSFPQLSEKEKWDLAFYVLSFRYKDGSYDGPRAKNAPILTLTDVASLSDNELTKKLVHMPRKEKTNTIAAARVRSQKQNTNALYQRAIQGIDQALAEYEKGNIDQARMIALSTYLERIEPIELKLQSSNRGLAKEIEKSMMIFRQRIEARDSVGEISALVAQIKQMLKRAESTASKTQSPWTIFWLSLGIVLREGIEALLIVMAALSVVRRGGSKRAERWIHGGWIVALLAGMVGWFFSGWILQLGGQKSETMEAFASFLAVAVLVYVGIWFHKEAQISQWTKIVDHKLKQSLTTGNMLGLGLISFLAVFRESFETILFLRSLTIGEAASSGSLMVWGVLAAIALAVGLVFVVVRITKTIPFSKVFFASSILMLVLAVILMGKGVHALQENGMLSMTPFGLDVSFDLLGLYPTIETLISQITVAMFCVLLITFGNRTRLRLSKSRIES